MSLLPFLRRHAALLVLGGIGLAAGLAVRALRGPAAFGRALDQALDLFLFILPSLLAGMLLAACLRALVPPGALARWMGAESGWRGLLVATLAGAATPGGPMAAFPLVLVLAGAGADRGALIAFILSWGLNGFQRVLVYELPLLGPDFTLLRLLATLPLAPLGGWIARRLPIAWTPPAMPPADPPAPRPPR